MINSDFLPYIAIVVVGIVFAIVSKDFFKPHHK